MVPSEDEGVINGLGSVQDFRQAESLHHGKVNAEVIFHRSLRMSAIRANSDLKAASMEVFPSGRSVGAEVRDVDRL